MAFEGGDRVKICSQGRAPLCASADECGGRLPREGLAARQLDLEAEVCHVLNSLKFEASYIYIHLCVCVYIFLLSNHLTSFCALVEQCGHWVGGRSSIPNGCIGREAGKERWQRGGSGLYVFAKQAGRNQVRAV